MLGLPVSAIGVGQVAVLVPPATMMCQGTVAEGDIIVSVKSCKLPSIVVSKSVPCRREEMRSASPGFAPEWVGARLEGRLRGKPLDARPPRVPSARALFSQKGQDKDTTQAQCLSQPVTQLQACFSKSLNSICGIRKDQTLQPPSQHLSTPHSAGRLPASLPRLGHPPSYPDSSSEPHRAILACPLSNHRLSADHPEHPLLPQLPPWAWVHTAAFPALLKLKRLFSPSQA